jgi:hypothetical protein
MTTITEQTETAPETKATKKASRGARRANVTPAKGKVAKKATPKKKAPKNARNGSKTATIIELLKRQCGATAKELLKATNWRPHSLRGFLSGIVGKKMGLTVTSTKGEDGERTYSIKA